MEPSLWYATATEKPWPLGRGESLSINLFFTRIKILTGGRGRRGIRPVIRPDAQSSDWASPFFKTVGVRFELTMPFPTYRISSAALSATQPPHHFKDEPTYSPRFRLGSTESRRVASRSGPTDRHALLSTIFPFICKSVYAILRVIRIVTNLQI